MLNPQITSCVLLFYLYSCLRCFINVSKHFPKFAYVFNTQDNIMFNL